MFSRFALSSVLAALLGANALAATLHVPAAYPTIQAAVDAAQPGDTIMIAPGVYRENVQIRTASLRLVGSGWWQTVVDGGGNDAVISVKDVAVTSFRIEGLTARNSRSSGSPFGSSSDAGIRMSSFSHTANGLISRCRIEDCYAGISTAGVRGKIKIEWTQIVDNARWGIYSGQATVDLWYTTVARNGFIGIEVGFGSLNSLNSIISHHGTYGVSINFPGRVIMATTCLWSNGINFWDNLTGRPFTLSYSVTNVHADPQFVDPAIGNYFLRPTSPCINKGIGGRDPDGTAPELGALWFNVNRVTWFYRTQGTACGQLVIGALNFPIIGGAAFLGTLDGAPPSAPVLALVGVDSTSLNGVPLPIDLGSIGATGCSLLVAPLVNVPGTADAAGHAELPLPVPNQSSVIGTTFFAQWVAVAPGINQAGLAFSDLLRVQIGN